MARAPPEVLIRSGCEDDLVQLNELYNHYVRETHATLTPGIQIRLLMGPHGPSLPKLWAWMMHPRARDQSMLSLCFAPLQDIATSWKSRSLSRLAPLKPLRETY